MLPASNRGAGQNLCFPDVCLTPAPPAPPVPIPYPNIGMNAQAQGFAPNVKISGMNALNLGSKISMTSGDEAGVAHPLKKGMGGYSMGNPIVTINKLPAINLTCLANGNMMNAPVGSVIVPSAVNVTYCDADAPSLRAGGLVPQVCDAPGAVSGALLANGVGRLRMERVPTDARARLSSLMRELLAQGARAWLFDLRDNPGGDVAAALQVASEFLPAGCVLAERVDADGDVEVHRSRNPLPDLRPMVVLVDRRTGSAAEVIAGALQAHARATLVGERTYGKASAQSVTVDASSRTRYATVAELVLPGGQRFDGEGLAPDHACDPAMALDRALAVLCERAGTMGTPAGGEG